MLKLMTWYFSLKITKMERVKYVLRLVMEIKYAGSGLVSNADCLSRTEPVTRLVKSAQCNGTRLVKSQCNGTRLVKSQCNGTTHYGNIRSRR